ncbi:hypothetical protein CP8484711_0687B, partial [Chlamydia psittaci 84-8471/1]
PPCVVAVYFLVKDHRLLLAQLPCNHIHPVDSTYNSS